MEQDKEEALIDYKVDMYIEYLERLDNEFLNYEYTDRIPVFHGELDSMPRDRKIDELVDRYNIVLSYEDITEWWAKERRVCIRKEVPGSAQALDYCIICGHKSKTPVCCKCKENK